jgi:hypothetical protein
MNKLFLLCAIIAASTIPVHAADDEGAIIAAAKSFVTANATVTTKITFTVEAIESDFARVKMAPEESGKGDPAWVFLQKKDGKWTGLTLGSSFTTEDYQQLGIPNALRVP